VRPDHGITVSRNGSHREHRACHPEHNAFTASTKPAVHVLIHSDVYILKFSDAEHTGGDGGHLSIDIHAFVGDQLARAGVFGVENGRRYEAFGDTAPGTSHGWPAVQGVSVLVGTQTTRATDR
jgi:hypothetical protein